MDLNGYWSTLLGISELFSFKLFIGTASQAFVSNQGFIAKSCFEIMLAIDKYAESRNKL